MMELIIVRHATAAPPRSFVSDDDRPLTPDGQKQAVAAGKAIRKLADEEVRILCSPKLRALETAQAIATELGAGPPETEPSLAGGVGPDVIVSSLEPCKSGMLILVGHAPDVGRILAHILDPGWPGAVPFPTAGYARIEVDGIPPREEGRLITFESP